MRMNMESLFALSSLFPSGILQEMCVNLVTRQLDISDNTATNETVLDTEHVRIFVWIRHTDVCQFYIQVLVNLETKNKVLLQESLFHY